MVQRLYAEQPTQDPIEGDKTTVFGDKSPGVRRIEAVTQCFQSWHLYVLFVSVFLVAYSYGLDGQVRFLYQTAALETFESSALISTITVVRSIVAAAAQPAFARFSDYFGRQTVFLMSVIFFTVGTIVQATSKNLSAFCGGAVLYQFGYTGAQLLLEVIIADCTSLRNRLFFSYIPATPFLINAWISGNLYTAVIAGSNWQWGIGMWAIIFPVLCIPLFASLLDAEWRAKRMGMLEGIPSPLRSLARADLWVDVFWQIDVVGLLLLAAVLALILLPFTLAGGVQDLWGTARVIAPLVIGFVVALPLFIFWELKLARHPAVPFRIMKDRQIIASLLIAVLLNTAWYTQGDYLLYLLQVAFDKDYIDASRVLNIYSFVSVVIGVCLGLVIRFVRRLKWFIVAGTLCFVLAFGLLIEFRGGEDTGHFAGLVAAEVILGIAGGLFPYPTQVMIQSAVQHERTAVMTSLYLACYSVGSALGNTIAGAIWTNKMPGEILRMLQQQGVADAESIALIGYTQPLTTYISTYPIGTPERTAIILAYRHVQRLLTITGISLSVLLVIISLCLRNPHLGDLQSNPEAEGMSGEKVSAVQAPYGSPVTEQTSPAHTAVEKKRFGGIFGKKTETV